MDMKIKTYTPALIVVPDVHGRDFWKTAKDYDCDVVFLGDYLDPYPLDGITKEAAVVQIVGHTRCKEPLDLITPFAVYDADACCCSQIDEMGEVSPLGQIRR